MTFLFKCNVFGPVLFHVYQLFLYDFLSNNILIQFAHIKYFCF